MATDRSTILVIEDEWSSRRFLTEALSDIAKVRCVASAAEAYTVLDESVDDVAVVITDVIMRGQSGIDFLAYLRNDLGRRDIPVIVYTAHGGTDMERLAFEGGATEFLTKPVALLRLRLRVAAMFELTRAISSAGTDSDRGRQVLAYDELRATLRTELQRAVTGGYCLLACRAHCDEFLREGSNTHGTREMVLQEMARRHFDHFRQPFANIWQEKSCSIGVLTMSHTVDSALRDSRMYRAWISEQALLESTSESRDHVGLGMLVYDFSVMEATERESIDINNLAHELLGKVDSASRAAAESAQVLVTVVQDVVTV